MKLDWAKIWWTCDRWRDRKRAKDPCRVGPLQSERRDHVERVVNAAIKRALKEERTTCEP